jgi:hypothetical protein
MPDRAPSLKRPPLARLLIMAAVIFLAALGVRVLHWQDNHAEHLRGDLEPVIMDSQYKIEVRRMRREGGLLFPREHADKGDAQMLLHPPGYAILVATLYRGSLADELYEELRWLQIILDAVAAVILFFIGVELLPVAVAFIAGSLVALSPHFSYYALSGTPDSLAVPPVLLAVYLIVRGIKRPRLVTFAAAGALVGLSCWLRANALLLAPVLAGVVWLLSTRDKRWRCSLALVCSTIIVIAPITIRNWVVFDAFVPLSLGSGVILIQGIADYDQEGRFGMPASHREILEKDFSWHGRPEYGRKAWKPDGIARDRYRLSRGLGVIADNPAWFLGVMIRRAAFMLSYNDPARSHWPERSATVPVISPQPPFNHQQTIAGDAEAVWNASPAQLLGDGAKISDRAEVSISAGEQMLSVEGDGSAYQDQFASSPIPVNDDTDYLLVIRSKSERGSMAARVTSEDRRVTLGSVVIKMQSLEGAQDEPPGDEDEDDEVAPAAILQQADGALRIPFASGGRSSVRLVLSNEGDANPATQVGGVELYALGPTPYAWTRFPRAIIRTIQRNLYNTWTLLPLVLAGIALLALANRRREILLLLAVPAYYLIFHSALHTEYRYILAIHFFLFLMAAVTFYVAGAGISERGRQVYRRVAGKDRGESRTANV